MRIEIAKHERMSETGKSLLRLIQNHDMPVLDLLVREAVQNSLDAAKSNSGYVDVDFNIRTFKRSELAVHFEGIEGRLAEVYPADEYRLMEIRDCNTQGLTGPLHDGEIGAGEYGNLIKLIYQIGMPQQKEGSGGSWGLGKTVYFRVGIGLVIYYSRIHENGEYRSRLAVCLVEDDSREDALLKDKGNHRGIAWWGQPATGGSTMPLTDEQEIQEVLNCLGCVPFQGDETGTAILIPFLRDDLRPELLLSTDEENDVRSSRIDLAWTHTDEEYIAAAIQRWYSPRLMNERYPYGSWLRASVNGQGITRDQFLPAFKVLQDLYNHAHSADGAEAVSNEDSGIQVAPVKLNRTFKGGTTAGWVAFAKLSKVDLRMEAPYNYPSPWAQVFGRELPDESNPPLMAFTRRPGMIVGFENSGKWVEGIPKTKEDEYLIAIFVANSSNTLIEANPKNPDRDFLLEEYIRGCEKADHTSWADWTPNQKNPLIIERIQRNVVKAVANAYSDRSDKGAGKKDIVLGKLLAGVLLPPEGFGNRGGIQPPKSPSGGNGQKAQAGRNPRLIDIAGPLYEGDAVRLDFELYTGNHDQPFEMNLKVISESGDIDADSWESDQGVGSKFPVSIHKVVIRSITAPKSNSNECAGDIVIVSPNGEAAQGEYIFAGIASRMHNQFCGLLCTGLTNRLVKGSVWIRSLDRNVRAAISVAAQPGGVNT